MTNGHLIAVLGGARETALAVDWLVQAGVKGFVIWENAATARQTKFASASFDQLPTATAILDASHAFDETTRATALRCAPGIPYARIGRASWSPTSEDNWTEVATLPEAVAALPNGARVFAATGRGSLSDLARHDGPVFLRQLKRHDLEMPLPNGRFVFGSAPFSEAEEISLFQELNIDVVLARNIGGAGSFPKLGAARKLRLPAVLVRPPPMPKGPQIGSYAEIKDWIASL